jgi:hypothetical protein
MSDEFAGGGVVAPASDEFARANYVIITGTRNAEWKSPLCFSPCHHASNL